MLESFPKPKNQEIQTERRESFKFNEFSHSLSSLGRTLNRCELIEDESRHKIQFDLREIEKSLSAKDINWQELNRTLNSLTQAIEGIEVVRRGNFRRDDVDSFRTVPRELRKLTGEAASLSRWLDKPEAEETKKLLGRLNTVVEDKTRYLDQLANKLEDIYR
ncbi:MAG: hypothetical protein Q7S34_02895 [bacterium]|nr:hypothetical protein [bacterium]